VDEDVETIDQELTEAFASCCGVNLAAGMVWRLYFGFRVFSVKGEVVAFQKALRLGAAEVVVLI